MKLHHKVAIGLLRLVGAVLILAGATIPAAGTDKEPYDVRKHVPLEKFLIQSHRGAGELEADNTMEAFELGWKLNTVPEADLRVTRDGIIVAFHDNDFRKLVKGASPELAAKGIKDLPWDEVKALDVGAWKGEKFAGRRVPRMADVFAALAARPGKQLYLDIKEMDLKKLATEVTAAKVGKQVIVASSKQSVLREWKGLVPDSETLLWMGGTEAELEKKFADVKKAEFKGITQLQIHVRMKSGTGGESDLIPSPEFLARTGDELRGHGVLFQSLPWGATDEKIYWRLLDLGVSSFATDHPKVTLEAVRKYYEKAKDRP